MTKEDERQRADDLSRDAAVIEPDSQESVSAQLDALRTQYLRLQERCAANLRREARASAETIGELERELEQALAERDTLKRDFGALLAKVDGDRAEAEKASTAKVHVDAAAVSSSAHFKKVQLRAELDATLLVRERRLLAETLLALDAARAQSREAASEPSDPQALKSQHDEAFRLLEALGRNLENPVSRQVPGLLQRIRSLAGRA